MTSRDDGKGLLPDGGTADRAGADEGTGGATAGDGGADAAGGTGTADDGDRGADAAGGAVGGIDLTERLRLELGLGGGTEVVNFTASKGIVLGIVVIVVVISVADLAFNDGTILETVVEALLG